MQQYLVGWLILLLVLAPIGGSVGGMIQDGSAAVPTGTSGNETTNATIIPHQHPDTAIDDGDPAQVVAHVDEDLTELLLLSAERLRERDYEGAQAALGPEYQRLLSQYEAAGGTAAGTFDVTELSQREAIALAQRYEGTRDQYTTALANDDEEAAREAARELQAIAGDVNVTAQELSENYDELDQVVEQDLSELSSAAEAVSERISRDAENIATNELEETILTINAANDTAAFTEPVQINGTLTTTDGDPVANETIQLQFSPDQTSLASTQPSRVTAPTAQTTTDANGTFTVQYRPVQYPLDAETLRVSYVPRPNTVYLSAAATTPLTVSGQAETDVVIETAPATTRFTDTVQVTGTTAIQTPNGTGTASVPIEVALGRQSLGTVMTTANGTFSLNRSLPANVRNGTQDIVVRLALTDSAVAPAVTSTTVQVTTTETELTLETEVKTSTNAVNTTPENDSTAAASDNVTPRTNPTATTTSGNTTTQSLEPASPQLQVTGTLTTLNGTSIPEQLVSLRINDTVRKTIETDENGTFSTVLSGGNREALADGMPLIAAFDGTGMNLDSTTATTVPFATTTNQQGSTTAETGQQTYRWQFLAITGVLGSIIGLLGWYVLIRGHPIRTLPLVRRVSSNADSESSAPKPVVGPEPAATPPPSTTESVTLLDDAEAIHSDDPTVAVRMAYTALRTAISGDTTGEAKTAQTHWEFYRAHRNESTSPEAFRVLTQTFERARFDNTELAPNEAETAVAAARQLLDPDPRPTTDGGTATDPASNGATGSDNDT